MNNMQDWNQFSRPPLSALKTITDGRLKGKSDINPQWRYQAMTEVYGPCGIGWKYTIDRLWTEAASEGQVFAFANISLYVRDRSNTTLNTWSEAIPGSGGSKFLINESRGLYSNDEAFKMAITDALGTAMKMLGVAAEIYLGNFDGSKYRTDKSCALPGAEDPNDKNGAALRASKTKEELIAAWEAIPAGLRGKYTSLKNEMKEKL